MSSELFEIFWDAGMRRVNKKAARKAFDRIIKLEDDKEEFVFMLQQDIKKRLAAAQFGFDAMHPATYLNGERWQDEIRQVNSRLLHTLTDRSWADGIELPGNTKTKNLRIADQLKNTDWAKNI